MTYLSKKSLYDEYISLISETLAQLESQFRLPKLHEALFGHPRKGLYDDTEWTEITERFSATRAWTRVSDLYDFAIDGILKNRSDPRWMIEEVDKLLPYLQATNPFVVCVKDTLLVLAQGRAALEAGFDLRFEALVKLADVDERTVRNAISAGELTFFKNDAKGLVNAVSARKWLEGRRGFVPTKFISTIGGAQLGDVKSPAQFGAFLNQHRTQRNTFPPPRGVPMAKQSIEELERGVFNLPLSTTFELADFYCLDRGEFTDCVMRVFFRDQYDAVLACQKKTSGQE